LRMREKEVEELPFYELDKVKGAILTDWFRSRDGYIVLVFRKGGKTYRVWIA